MAVRNFHVFQKHFRISLNVEALDSILTVDRVPVAIYYEIGLSINLNHVIEQDVASKFNHGAISNGVLERPLVKNDNHHVRKNRPTERALLSNASRPFTPSWRASLSF